MDVINMVYVVQATIALNDFAKTKERKELKNITMAFTNIVDAVKCYDKIGNINKSIISYKIGDGQLIAERNDDYISPSLRNQYEADSKIASDIWKKYNRTIKEICDQ